MRSDEPPSNLVRIRSLLLRGHMLGLIVYICSVPERAGNALLGLTLLICAVLWSSWDGILCGHQPHRWSIALPEGTLLYVGAIAVANLLRLIFGQFTIG